MDREHPGPETGGGAHRLGHDRRNVVILEIKEDPVPAVGER